MKAYDKACPSFERRVSKKIGKAAIGAERRAAGHT